MSQMRMEPCKCSNCGHEQVYDWVITWNSCCPINPNNKCYKCGTKLTFDDIVKEKASGFYKNMMIIQKVYSKINEDNEDDEDICVKCGSLNIYRSSIFNSGNKEYYINKIHCFKRVLCCEDCGHEENVTDIKNCKEMGLEYIGQDNEGYFIFKETDEYKTIMDNYNRERDAEFERVKFEMMKSEKLMGLI